MSITRSGIMSSSRGGNATSMSQLLSCAEHISTVGQLTPTIHQSSQVTQCPWTISPFTYKILSSFFMKDEIPQAFMSIKSDFWSLHISRLRPKETSEISSLQGFKRSISAVSSLWLWHGYRPSLAVPSFDRIVLLRVYHKEFSSPTLKVSLLYR